MAQSAVQLSPSDRSTRFAAAVLFAGAGDSRRPGVMEAGKIFRNIGPGADGKGWGLGNPAKPSDTRTKPTTDRKSVV